jgi:hypothetical protein
LFYLDWSNSSNNLIIAVYRDPVTFPASCSLPGVSTPQRESPSTLPACQLISNDLTSAKPKIMAINQGPGSALYFVVVTNNSATSEPIRFGVTYY